MTDSGLLELYKKDVHKAVRLTAEIYHGYVLKIISSKLIGASSEDIEETVSDVFIRFWNDIGRVDLSRGSIKAYISVLAQSIAKNKLKELSRRKEMPLDETEASSDRPIENYIDREALIQALNRLDSTDRKIVMMRFYYTIPHAEIAKLVGMSEAAVRKRLERALKKLRKETEGLL